MGVKLVFSSDCFVVFSEMSTTSSAKANNGKAGIGNVKRRKEWQTSPLGENGLGKYRAFAEQHEDRIKWVTMNLTGPKCHGIWFAPVVFN